MSVLADTVPVTRQAMASDAEAIVRMFQQFVSSTQYARYVGSNPASCAQMIKRMLESDDAAIFVVGDDPIIGMLGVMVFVQPFSGEIVASELFWWLDPAHRGHGGWLLRRAEKWARTHGARRMSMMAPADKERVAMIYRAFGYSEVEHVYQRDL